MVRCVGWTGLTIVMNTDILMEGGLLGIDIKDTKPSLSTFVLVSPVFFTNSLFHIPIKTK